MRRETAAAYCAALELVGVTGWRRTDAQEWFTILSNGV